MMALAASIVLAIAAWASYQMVLTARSDAMIDEAIAARDSTQPVQVAAADAQAVSAALGTRVKLPDLAKAGYRLAQVAVLKEGRVHAVRIDYRSQDNRLFTLYLKPSTGRENFDLAKRGNLRICLWQDDVLASVMLGEMSAGEMLRVASLAYNGLYF